MAEKLNVMRQIVIDLGTVFPKLVVGQEIYLSPRIIAVSSMANLEIQVCEGGAAYNAHEGSCRSEDFAIQVGIFHVYRLDSGGRYSKALTDLATSLFAIKEIVIDQLDGSFLTENLLHRPLIILTESEVTETKNENQLLRTLTFVAGLNVEMN